MNYYKKCNLIAGWGAFALATIVYLLTMEPTASLWDCAEFIATSYKLEVGHPPGAPLFMMIARFFTIFAPSTEAIPVMVNIMSCLASGFTILFLFWTITHLAKKIYSRKGSELSKAETLTVMGAGIIGAIAYTFTDTFWFSAIEAEVYALSSMFTALVVWAMLQWENVADEPHANRWLVLIAYLMGLSIGIHILNLLTVPALVFIYYFRKTTKVTGKGLIKATLISGVILVTINYIIIPYTVAIGAFIDKMFVNGLGLPVNLGLTLFVITLFVLCAWGIWKTHKAGKRLANIIILCTTVILIGYSSYASVIIRAAANPPMNSNDPSNPYSLLSLLNRDQYGNRPLLYGPAYSSPIEGMEETTTWYLGDDGKYAKTTYASGYEYPNKFMFFFPRMYQKEKAEAYQAWADVKGRKIPYENQFVTVPTFGENLKFFFSYQLNFMYWRYFLWNFVGRQSDIQSTGEITDGQWLSGIKFIDELYLGPQDNLPEDVANNKGRNKYYFLPFILGLIGLIYQLNRDKRNFTVVMWLFLMMGIVLVLYFNTTPGEPRERDYVYAGSFYAFCIWIGLGVMWVKEMIQKVYKKQNVIPAAAATLICSCVPVILAAENWDDHDRSHRYIAKDIGYNYLESCLPNSIVMNYGDNDTFPLWYNQEVEGVRTDVRVMNMSYLGGDWYIDQMRIKSNESDAVPFSIPRKKLYENDAFYVNNLIDGYINIKQAIDFVISEDPRTKLKLSSTSLDFLPTNKLALPVNKENAITSGIVKPEDAHLMVDTVFIDVNREILQKPDLMLLDLLANFEWERPLYFTQTFNIASLGLREYLQFDGYAYRFVPIKTPVKSFLDIGRIDTEYLYDNLMNKFKFGNVQDPRVYADYFVQYNFNASGARSAFARLAKGLIEEGDTVKAIEVLDAGIEKMPFSQIRHTYKLTQPLIEAYYLAGAMEKGDNVMMSYSKNLMEYINYYSQFSGAKAELVEDAIRENISYLDDMYRMARYFNRNEIATMIDNFYDRGEMINFNPDEVVKK